jgi:sortase (surface protein transpeptidase)
VPGGVRRVEVADGAVPTWVSIPRFGVRAPIVPKGIAADGAMDTPSSPSIVGWYLYGARLGDTWGTMVLDGHVDSAATGPGAFYNIVRLRPGDTIVVGGPTGSARYAVTDVTERRKSPVPATDVFRMDVPARLVLITCGGAFNAATGHYVDNVVVIARPA